jgi:hypothetical protein
MTIRTSGGKLLTKDGKLSCDCCGGGWVCDVTGGGACCEAGVAGAPPTCSIKPECDCKGPGQTWKGIGTKCECNKCLIASNCFCYCTAQGGKVPRFIDVRVQITAAGAAGSGCDVSLDQNVTLTFSSANYEDGVSNGGIVYCYYWQFVSPSLSVTANSLLNNSQGKEVLSVTAMYKFCSAIGNWGDTLQSFVAKTNDSTGVCYQRHVGAAMSSTEPNTGLASLTITITGVRE